MNGSGFLGVRLVQVHLTRRCNLACEHCYSESGPSASGEVPLGPLMARLEFLRGEGYEVVSLSGGEPMLYGNLHELAVGCAELGFRLNVVSNGTLFDRARLALLREHASVVAVSIDGLEARHDRIRRRRGAFQAALTGCQRLGDAGVEFAIVHCFSPDSIGEIPALCDLAVERGARLIQLHPMSTTGRGAAFGPAQRLSSADLERVAVIAELLRFAYDGRILLQLDVVGSQQVRDHRGQYPVLSRPGPTLSLSDLVNPLVVDERTRLWPLAYGIAADQMIAPDGEAWHEAALRYRAERAAPLTRLISDAIEAIETDFVDWYAHVVGVSHRRTGDGDSSGALRMGAVE